MARELVGYLIIEDEAVGAGEIEPHEGSYYEDKDRAKAAPLVACRPCAPLGVCVCIPRAELLDAPAPLDIQDDAPLYIPAPRTGA